MSEFGTLFQDCNLPKSVFRDIASDNAELSDFDQILIGKCEPLDFEIGEISEIELIAQTPV